MDPSRSRRVSETYQSQMEDSVRRILISKVKLQPKQQQQDKVARPVLFQLTLITIRLREHVGTAPAAAWLGRPCLLSGTFHASTTFLFPSGNYQTALVQLYCLEKYFLTLCTTHPRLASWS